VYDIIIAIDEQQNNKRYTASEKAPKLKKRKRQDADADSEYGIARGIDFRNVEFVVNFDVPRSQDSYIHRVGRTARAGKSGTGWFIKHSVKE
jgi:ATP-dependent RNA helicase DDX56/DBP9